MNCVNHPEREQVAFCQVCGRPLCSDCVRKVGNSVYCEPDLAAMLGQSAATANPAAGAAVPPVGTVPPGPYDPSAGNPGLAALLGFIPGVGAMYNGQYVKGLIHLTVFVILCSLAGDHGIFLLFVFGWVFYQVIEAYQTAVAKREGKPLPNPLGLNDIGTRLGQKPWGVPVTPPPAAAPFAGTTPPASAGAPVAEPYAAPSTAESATANPYSYSYNYSYNYPPAPPAPPTGEYPPVPPAPAQGMFGMNIPSGAVWLIALGIIFLLGMARPFSFIRAGLLWPVFMMAAGVYWYTRTYQQSLIYTEGNGATHTYLQFRALRKSGWIVLVGLLWLLDTTRVLHFGASWPLILIFVGLMAIGDRFFVQQMVHESTYGPAPVVTPPPAAPTTSIVPANDFARDPERDEEGR